MSDLGKSDDYVFISYRSSERDRVRSIVSLLEQHQLRCWWDQDIQKDWGADIERALDGAAYVLGFISEESQQSPAVFGEFKRAAASDKLIPIRIDKSQINYRFDTIVAFLNYFDLSDPSVAADHPEFLRLLNRISSRAIGEASRHDVEDSGRALTAWFEDPAKLRHFPYMMSLCVFEHSTHERVSYFAQRLEDFLRERGYPAEMFGAYQIVPRSSRLNAVRAHTIKFKPATLPYDMEYVEFLDQAFRPSYLNFLWREIDQLRPAIREWMEQIVESNDDDDRDTVAVAIAILGRENFNSVFLSVLRRWLFSGNDAHAWAADLSLYLMSFDPTIKDFIRQEIYRLLNLEGAEAQEVSGNKGATNAALRLACGYVGIGMPEVVVDLLPRFQAAIEKAFQNDQHGEAVTLIKQVGDNVNRMTKRALQEPLMLREGLRNFFVEIARWTTSTQDKGRRFFPLLIAMQIADGLRSGSAPDRLDGLCLLVHGEDGAIDSGVLDALAMVFKDSLEDGSLHIRDLAKDLLKSWSEAARARDASQELLATVRCVLQRLYDFSAEGNDRDRVEFLAKGLIDANTGAIA